MAALHLGIFVVWIPAVLVSIRRAGSHPKKDFWKIALRGCPAWMKYMTYGFFAYAGLNFILFVSGKPDHGDGGVMPPEVVRGFSGHWMAFYAAALAILYSDAKLSDEGGESVKPLTGERNKPLGL